MARKDESALPSKELIEHGIVTAENSDLGSAENLLDIKVDFTTVHCKIM